MIFNGTQRGVLARILRGTSIALAAATGVGVLTLGAPSAHAQFGLFTCKSGFVWREAYPADLVCVRPITRERTREENRLGPSRRLPGRLTCRQGFVWREASPSDLVCVPTSRRDQARSDNRLAQDRWANI
jgi:hypothetical protein